jgi:hypothetical protein
MGLLTHFESGGRTDAVLRDSRGTPVAALEWEWAALHRGDAIITEFGKLKTLCAEGACKGVRFAGLIGYARRNSAKARDDYTTRFTAVLEGYTHRWARKRGQATFGGIKVGRLPLSSAIRRGGCLYAAVHELQCGSRPSSIPP